MAEQDGRGPIQEESKATLHLSPGQRSYYQIVSGVEGSPRAISQSWAFKVFHAGLGDKVMGQDTRQKGNPLPPPIGVIEVIHAAPEKLIAGRRKGVLTVAPVEGNPDEQSSGKKMKFARKSITFDDDDLEGMIQPHDDALVVMAWISGFLEKG